MRAADGKFARRCVCFNAEGARCGREAAPGSDRCSLHEASNAEPQWSIPWTRRMAVNQVRCFGSLSKIAAAEAAGVFDGAMPDYLCDGLSIRLAREGRRWLELHGDGEWLARFDQEHPQ